MICPKCNTTITDNSVFCSNCGENLKKEENRTIYCSACGERIKEENKFCAKCGTKVGVETQPSINTTLNTEKLSSEKITGSYFVSIISAIVSFIIRIANQDTYYSVINFVDNRKVVGLDSEIKPFITIIPIIAIIVLSLLIVSDKKTTTQKKTTAFIINAIFIALSFLFIWFDIPYSIIDF